METAFVITAAILAAPLAVLMSAFPSSPPVDAVPPAERAPIVLVQGVDVVKADPIVTRDGDLEIISPWARATPPGQQIGGIYLGIRNTGTEPISLVKAETPVARRTDLHQIKFDKGYPEMLPADGPVEIRPGEEVEFKPGGLHLMMQGMQELLRVGKSYPLTLSFSDGRTVTVDMIVWDVGTVYEK